ncbi:MAG: ABC transporter permease [Lachnospiraceae bacterium]|nr:ABC transporter permease [Lachnospiraceae bacterium]
MEKSAVKIKARKLFTSSQFFVFVIIFVLGTVIQLCSGEFYTANSLVDILRAMIVIISGGTDVSFPAIASLTLAVVTSCMDKMDYSGPIILVFLFAAVLGALIGSLNGVLVGIYQIPTLIASLGTTTICVGIMLGLMKAREIAVLPPAMKAMSEASLVTVRSKSLNMASSLPAVFLVLVLVVAATWFLLNKTYVGRSIFAIGGDIQAARRVGFPVVRSQMMIYMYSGMLAGLGGITRVFLMGAAYPQNLLGSELKIIAAVVLGGTRITGGIGSITGSLLGVALFAIIENSLQLIGVPSYWQKAFTGIFIIVGTGLTSYQVLRKNRQTHVDVDGA